MRILFGLPGAVTPVLLLIAGCLFAVRLRGFPFLHPARTWRAMLGGKGRRESFSALTVALAGTLGVGNITGVALAVAVGGAGTVFWMWVSALFAMIVRFAEVVLALDRRERGIGAMYFLPRATGTVFAVFCAASALFLGGGLQSAAAAECASSVFGIPRLPVGILFLILGGAVIFGGMKSIARLTVLLIPFVTLLYLFLSAGVLVTYAERIPAVFRLIVSDAFRPGGMMGGVFGFLFSERLRIGFARGLLSNEAGCGTAPMAHAGATHAEPVRQGLWGIFEVFLDTVVLCTLTALVVLLPGGGFSKDNPISSVLNAFSSVFGRGAAVATVLAVFLFAYASVLSWSHYGVSAFGFLFPSPRAKRFYLLVLCLSLPAGAVLPLGFLYGATDFLLAGMTLINLSALLKSADRICILSAGFLSENGFMRFRPDRIRGSAIADARPKRQGVRAYREPHARK